MVRRTMVPLQQGETDRSKAPALGKARLVNSDPTANRRRTRDLAMFNLAIDKESPVVRLSESNGHGQISR
jgi:hypothetical protein